jgi:hypothetical protein
MKESAAGPKEKQEQEKRSHQINPLRFPRIPRKHPKQRDDLILQRVVVGHVLSRLIHQLVEGK